MGAQEMKDRDKLEHGLMIAPPTADWSFLRSVLEQGAAIQQDYAAGKYSNYEEYAARIDEAAREREAMLASVNAKP